MADIRRVKLPNGTTYNIKDNTARSNINNIVNGTTKLPYGKSLSITTSNELKLLDPNNNVLSTVYIPSVVMIQPDTNLGWVTTDGISVLDLPLYTIVELGVPYDQNNKHNLVIEDSYGIPFVSTATSKTFVGYIFSNDGISAYIMKLYNGIQSYPSVPYASEWIAFAYNAIEDFLRDRYDICSIETIPPDNSMIKITKSNNTAIAYQEAKQYELTNGLVILAIKLSNNSSESTLKFSGETITNLNISVVACASDNSTAEAKRAVTNNDFSVSVTNLVSSQYAQYNYLLLYGHRL